MSRFIKLDPDSEILESMLSAGKHQEFILLTIIAKRARRKPDPVKKLGSGESMLGDHLAYGMTRQGYRTALNNLKEWGLISARVTTKGTVAKLCGTSIYDINASASNQQTNQQPTNSQPTGNQRVTTNKNGKKEKNENNISLERIGEVSEQRAIDFIAHREAIKKPLTQRGFDLVMAEANRAQTVGFTPDQAIDEAIMAGWQGLKLDWLAKRAPQQNVTPIKPKGPKLFPGVVDFRRSGTDQ